MKRNNYEKDCESEKKINNNKRSRVYKIIFIQVVSSFVK